MFARWHPDGRLFAPVEAVAATAMAMSPMLFLYGTGFAPLGRSRDPDRDLPRPPAHGRCAYHRRAQAMVAASGVDVRHCALVRRRHVRGQGQPEASLGARDGDAWLVACRRRATRGPWPHRARPAREVLIPPRPSLPTTGATRGPCNGYVIDHVVPLKRGGADALDNMQWLTRHDAKLKDRIE
jgi:hypothetical protein